MNCPYCANAVPDGAAFCGNCGAKLEPANIPGSPAPQAPVSPPPYVMEPAAPPPYVMEPVAPPPGFTPAYTPPPPPAKKSNTTLIIIVVVVLLLLCCCCGVLIAFSQMGSVFTDIATQLMTPTPRR